jgi:soluble lytic murein transglycosylase-like protein
VKNTFVILVLAVCVIGSSRPARAQIYSWKDAKGILVLSTTPQGGVQRAVNVSTAGVMAPPLVGRRSAYDPLIRVHANNHGIRAELIRAVIQVESAFNPRAVSPKGAKGLMQLMPATAVRFGVVDSFNPGENIRAGVSYLKQLLDRYNNDEQLALAAYNAGPGAVDKYGSKIPPYRETQDYVRRITGLNGTVRAAPESKIYKSVDIVDGHSVVRYTNTRPSGDDCSEVGR